MIRLINEMTRLIRWRSYMCRTSMLGSWLLAFPGDIINNAIYRKHIALYVSSRASARAGARARERKCVCVRARARVSQRAALHSIPSVLPLIFEPLVKEADFYCTQYVPVFLPLYLVVYNSITARIHWSSYKSKQRQILRGADTYHILPFPDGVNWDGTNSFEHYVTMSYCYTLYI